MKTPVLNLGMASAISMIALLLVLTTGCENKKLSQLEEEKHKLEAEHALLVKSLEELKRQNESNSLTNAALEKTLHQQKEINEKLTKDLELFRGKISAALRELSSFLSVLPEIEDASLFTEQMLRCKSELAKIQSDLPDSPAKTKLDQAMKHITRMNDVHSSWKSKASETVHLLEIELDSLDYSYRAKLLGPSEWNYKVYRTKLDAISKQEDLKKRRQEAIDVEIDGVLSIKTNLQGMLSASL